MAYTNSPLVSYTKISPNQSGTRKYPITRISIHCVCGQCSVETLGSVFAPTSRKASSNYGIGYDGKVGMYVEEKDRSWCTSSSDNDNRAVTIEVASDTTHPYAVRDAAYKSLLDLVTDICKRNGKKKVVWFGDKAKTLAYTPAADEMVLTVHRWFANKSCPGDYLYNLHPQIAAEVTKRLGGSSKATTPDLHSIQATDLKNMDDAAVIARIAPLFTEDQKESGVLASVSMAQFILESGYGKQKLAQASNNCFGMKKQLSGNNWDGSAWDGISVYKHRTKEQNADGSYRTIAAEFRAYPNIVNSIRDHSAYLIGAKNGSKYRYDGLKGCTDYRKAAQIIKDGGYATSHAYVDKLCKVVEKWNLTQYDVKSKPGSTQTATGDTTTKKFPYLVKVKADALNVRKGPGVNYAITLTIRGRGIYTIVDEKDGWGKLKSGAGWIRLSYTEKR